MEPDPRKADTRTFSLFTRRVLVVLGLVVLALALWQIAHVLLLLFLGALLAVFVRALADLLSARTALPQGTALLLVGAALVVLAGLGGWLFGAQIAQQAGRLVQELQASAQQLRQYEWGRFILENAPQFGEDIAQRGGIFAQLTGAVSVVAGVLTNIVLVIFIGVFLTYRPATYERAVVLLVPERRRARAREVLRAVGRALRRWLLAQFLAMIAVGLLTTLGLMLLGMPLAPVLGLLAAVLEFIPFFGPILAAVPAILLAFVEGPSQALYVALFYLVIQQLEGNLITPLAQKREASLPPVITLTAVVAFGILFGPLGIIVATPLALVLLVLVKMLYVEDVLGTPTRLPGQR